MVKIIVLRIKKVINERIVDVGCSLIFNIILLRFLRKTRGNKMNFLINKRCNIEKNKQI